MASPSCFCLAASVLRGHLELSGPVTAAELGDRCALTPSKVAIGLAVLEQFIDHAVALLSGADTGHRTADTASHG